jgi:hypothetical protein
MSTSRRGILPAVMAALVLGAAALGASPRAEESPTELRESLRRATLKAIELDLGAYQQKLETAMAGTGPEENREKFRERIAALTAARDRLERMPAAEYPDPVASKPDASTVLDESTAWGPMLPAQQREAVVEVKGKYELGSQLEVEGTSRSGPFFHLAGIAGGKVGILKPGKRLRVTMYLVYRREYFGLIGDYYVYVAKVR